uniref:Integrase catalytic domain-containing protein n=1 Tax=Lactuca sativa TaxID=4236 RepID=A0A9R1V3X8_LACSA|nr:hypothetical protein LSAT_V11C600327230 [Lactuca sativa]
MLWDALAVTYSSGRDKLQTFNLHVKANDIKQNDNTLEEFWITLQGVWGEIDRIDPNPMKCPDDIKTYARIRSEQKLFQFLNSLNQKYESIKREILRLEPLPSAEAAYATIRKEAAHQNILGTTNHTQGIAAGMVATETRGMGLVTKGVITVACQKHTKEQCFGLVGYPEWWVDGHKKSTKGLGPEKGRAPTTYKNIDRKTATEFGGVAATRIDEEVEGFSMETGTWSFENHKKNLDINGCAIVAQNYKIKHESSWIFDCGATDTMTYDLSDFVVSTKPTKSYFQTANGEKMNVKNGGKIEISPTLNLSNCLYAPALSHKLLSISHVSKELNCSVLMQPTFCILQDIRTGAIIGRDTERQGLYYVDEIFRSDNGGEFVNSEMKSFFQTKGIIHQTTCPHTPEQNGVAERKNRILLEITRALLIESQTPKFFWPEALVTAAYLVNRLPTQILKSKTPLQTLTEYTKLPSVLTLEPRIFGCTVFVHIPEANRSKFDPYAERCVFVGYGITQKGYRCYNPKTRHMFTTMNYDFVETKYYYASQHSGQGVTECIDTLNWLRYYTSKEGRSHILQNETPLPTKPTNVSATQATAPDLIPEVSNTHPSHPDLSETLSTSGQSENGHEQENTLVEQAEEQEHVEEQEAVETPAEGYVLPPRSNRGVPPKRYSPEKESRGDRYPVANIAKGNLSKGAKAFVSSLYSNEIPTTTEQALKSKQLRDAMEEEMKALTKNNTCENVTT